MGRSQQHVVQQNNHNSAKQDRRERIRKERATRDAKKAAKAKTEAAQALQENPPVVQNIDSSTHNRDGSTHITINFHETAQNTTSPTAPSGSKKKQRATNAAVPQSTKIKEPSANKALKLEARRLKREQRLALIAAANTKSTAESQPEKLEVAKPPAAANIKPAVAVMPTMPTAEPATPQATIVATTQPFAPRNDEQAEFLEALQDYPLVIGVGPAGTGKTFLAAMTGIQMLKAGTIDTIILTRAPVEAGKELGFLPGTADAKMAPYIEPLFESIKKCIGEKPFTEMRRKGQILIKPINYMRGATLERTMAIVDEAQNLTRQELQLVMGRLGNSGRLVFIGDPAQVDLQPKASWQQSVQRSLRQAFIDAKRTFGLPARDMLVPPDASGFAELIKLMEIDVIPYGAVGAQSVKVVRLTTTQRNPVFHDIMDAYQRAQQPLPKQASRPTITTAFSQTQNALTRTQGDEAKPIPANSNVNLNGHRPPSDHAAPRL